MNGTILYPVLFLFVMNIIHWLRIDHLEKEIKSEKQKSEDYRHLVDGIILALESMEEEESDREKYWEREKEKTIKELQKIQKGDVDYNYLR